MRCAGSSFVWRQQAQGTVTSAWDVGGRRTRITHPDGFYVDQDYLVTGEVQKIRENGATSGVGVLATYAYDDLGRRTSLTFGNGNSTSYSYDAVSRLSSLVHDASGNTYDQTLSFSYNPASEIYQNTRSNDAYAWTGNTLGSTSSSANGLNQLTAIGGASATYDAKGNMTYDPTLAGSYAYSSENLLTGANGPITGGTWGFLKYDPLMRLVESGVFSSRQFVHDGEAWTAEYGGGIERARYVFGASADEPLVSYEGTGLATRRFLHADERGSIVALSDDAGNAVGINTFDEYGRMGPNNLGRFQFAGAPSETISDLYYLRNRFYNYRTGTFPQTDPIGYAGGMNLYAYVQGNPVNFVDPQGLGCIRLFENHGVLDLNTGQITWTDSIALADMCTPDLSGPRAAGGGGAGAGNGGATPGGRSDDTIVVTGSRRRPFGPAIQISEIRPDFFLHHYLFGHGENVCLTSNQFIDIARHAHPVPGTGIWWSSENYSTTVTFDTFAYRNTFGTATMSYSNGVPVGFEDLYNMDPKPEGVRSRGAENATSMGRFLGRITGARPFQTGYPCV